MFHDTENMLSLKGTDAQIFLCSLTETTCFLFIGGVISQDYTKTENASNST